MNYYASSSPTLVLTPNQQDHQLHYFSSHYQDHQPNDPIMNAAAFADLPLSTTVADLPTSSASSATTAATLAATRKTMRPRFPRPPSLNYLANSRPSISGRKRSIADVHDNEPHEDADGSYVSPTDQPPSPPKPRGEPIYGPGMTLIYPEDPAFSIAAESQTGTWVEERNEQAEAEAAEAAARPAVISRKSQRLIEPVSIAIDTSVTPMNANTTSNGVSPTSTELPVDRLSLTLGIGWKRIPVSQAPAVKGWEKFILNHFDNILDPTILLHNEGLRVYLVRSLSSASDTQECWWVFQEDLSQCRLVGFCEEDAIRNLQKGETMGPTIPAQAEARRPSIPNVEQMPMMAAIPATGNDDVEMEM